MPLGKSTRVLGGEKHVTVFSSVPHAYISFFFFFSKGKILMGVGE